MLTLNGGALEDAVRVEEYGVYAAKLLRQLQDQTGEQRPSELAQAEQLHDRDGIVAAAA